MSTDQMTLLQAAAALRRQEFDGLRLFRPTNVQAAGLRLLAKDNIFEAMVVGGNRSGKTLTATAFVAAYLRDEPITCWDGSEIHCRPSWLRGKPVNVWIIGNQLKHIGQTLYRMLFQGDKDQTGAFKIIRDETTGAWRSWQPEMFKNDRSRKSETRWAPPFIPAYMVEKWDWAPGRKTAHEFRSFQLTNGAMGYGFASSGEVKQGDPVSLIWNDEDITNKWYYSEWLMRLRDDEGKILWSTIPRDQCHVFNTRLDAIEEEMERVEKGEADENTIALARVNLSYLDNPIIADRQKELAMEQLGDRDTLRRIYGVRSTRLISVYQDYSPSLHCAWYDDESMNDGVAKRLKENNWIPPEDWTRELILDPGTQKPCILLGAIPPPILWDEQEPYFIIYREIYDPKKRYTPNELAARVMSTEADYQFERFIIDGRMGRQTPPGYVERIETQYSKAFAAAKLRSRQTGSSFIHGDDDFSRRSLQVIRALRMRNCGRPQLRILNQACPFTVRQMQSNVRKTDPEGNPLEAAADHQQDDCRVCIEYWISRRPNYRAPDNSDPVFLEPAEAAYRNLVKEWEAKKASGPASKGILVGAPA